MIAAAEFGQTRPTTRRLRALLENLELVSGSKGCFPSIDLLAGRMGTTHRTIQRTLAHAAQLGLVASTGRIIPGYGQVENLYHVQWDRLRTYVPADEIARIDHRLGRQSSAKPAANDAGQTGGNLSPGPQKCHRPPRPRVTGPPDTLSPRLSNASNDRAAAERRQLVDLIFSTGVNCADEAVAVALAAGCQLVEIEAAVNWYREHAHEFDGGPGVLYVQIMRMRPGGRSRLAEVETQNQASGCRREQAGPGGPDHSAGEAGREARAPDRGRTGGRGPHLGRPGSLTQKGLWR
jgi:hypothetical protein